MSEAEYLEMRKTIRWAVAYELLLWAKTFPTTAETDAVATCAHCVAAEEYPPLADRSS